MKNDLFSFPTVEISTDGNRVHFEGVLETVLGLSSPASPRTVAFHAYGRVLAALRDWRVTAVVELGDNNRAPGFYPDTMAEVLARDDHVRWSYHALLTVLAYCVPDTIGGIAPPIAGGDRKE